METKLGLFITIIDGGIESIVIDLSNEDVIDEEIMLCITEQLYKGYSILDLRTI